MTIETEIALINGCIRHERTAQYALYEQYKTAMFSTLYRMLGDFEEAEDALQEGFMEVFKRIADFRKDSTLGAWIRTIMVRKAIEKLRKRKVTEEIETALLTDFIPPDDMSGEAIEQAILRLPAGCRSVFLLIEVEGYSHKETADLLNVSEGTTKSQLSYAKKLLRNLLSEYRN